MIKRIIVRGIMACLCLIFTATIYSPVLAQEVVSAVEESELSFEEKQRAILENGVFVVNGFLMGAWDGENWLSATTYNSYIPEYMYYEIYTIEKDPKNHFSVKTQMTDIGHKYIDNSELYTPGGNVNMKEFDSNILMDSIDYLAARNAEPLELMQINNLHPGNPVYQEWVDEIILTGENPDIELRVRDVYGFKEYNGSNLTYLIIADNGYQQGLHGELIFIRREVSESDYKSLVLYNNIFIYGAPDIFYPSRLVFVSDLNHDGEDEYIMQVRSNGELSQMAYVIYSYENGEYKEVLTQGWSD